MGRERFFDGNLGRDPNKIENHCSTRYRRAAKDTKRRCFFFSRFDDILLSYHIMQWSLWNRTPCCGSNDFAHQRCAAIKTRRRKWLIFNNSENMRIELIIIHIYIGINMYNVYRTRGTDNTSSFYHKSKETTRWNIIPRPKTVFFFFFYRTSLKIVSENVIGSDDPARRRP